MHRRTTIAVPVAAVLIATITVPGTAQADQQPGDDVVDQALALGLPVGDKLAAPAARSTGGPPPGANPYLALLEDPAQARYGEWAEYLADKAAADDAAAQQAAGASGASPLIVREREPAGTRGPNDTYRKAQRVERFGTGRGERSVASLRGRLSNEAVQTRAIRPSNEDDGSIPLARATGVGTTNAGITTTGTIGDGPHGSARSGSGDFDVYRVDGVPGEQLVVDIDTTTGELDSILLLLDEAGNILAANDDEALGSFDSKLSFTVPDDGEYYVFVSGFLTLPQDPFDSGSGTGADTEGPYALSITTGEVDTDVFAVNLAVGDTLGLSVSGAGTYLGVLDPGGDLVHGSTQDFTAVYPAESPLPGGGNAVTDHVVDEAGWHYITVAGNTGAYDVTTEAYRPGNEGGAVQTLYLDFDGARFNTNIFGGPGVRTLSPMRSFLPAWGLRNSDYEPLARQIIATVEENVRLDLQRSGVDPDFRVRVRNSLDHPDTFGQSNVSRVIVGGTIAQSGIDTIGIAQSIDPGNFGKEETAIVLLDVLSDSDPENDASLNYYLRPRSNTIKFIGTAVGNVTSHEAGHFFGDWHVDQFNDTLNLMDQGGNFPLLFGVGRDGVGGTADDPDVDFGEDVFNPNEGFLGIEDTATRISAALVE